MRFAFASCSNWQLGYFSAYRHMAAENPDLVVFLGDYIYEYTIAGSNVLRNHDGPTTIDLTGYPTDMRFIALIPIYRRSMPQLHV
jgi:alkaline phosphatase D